MHRPLQGPGGIPIEIYARLGDAELAAMPDDKKPGLLVSSARSSIRSDDCFRQRMVRPRSTATCSA